MTYEFFISASCTNKLSREIIDLIMYLVKKYPTLKEIDISSIEGVVKLKFFDKEILDPHFIRTTEGKVLIESYGKKCFIHFSEVVGD